MIFSFDRTVVVVIRKKKNSEAKTQKFKRDAALAAMQNGWLIKNQVYTL